MWLGIECFEQVIGHTEQNRTLVSIKKNGQDVPFFFLCQDFEVVSKKRHTSREVPMRSFLYGNYWVNGPMIHGVFCSLLGVGTPILWLKRLIPNAILNRNITFFLAR